MMNFDMPSFKDPHSGTTYVWDPTSQSFAPSEHSDLEGKVDRGHASGGDNDLFDPAQGGNGEGHGDMFKTKNPMQEGVYAAVEDLESPEDQQHAKDLLEWARSIPEHGLQFEEWQKRKHPDQAIMSAWNGNGLGMDSPQEYAQRIMADAFQRGLTKPQDISNEITWWLKDRGMEPEGAELMADQLVDRFYDQMRSNLAGYDDPEAEQTDFRGLADPPVELIGAQPNNALYSNRAFVTCPNCGEEATTDVCPRCNKELSPEWHKEEQKWDPEAHPQRDNTNEFYSDPQRVPKTNWGVTDNSFPSMVSKVWHPVDISADECWSVR